MLRTILVITIIFYITNIYAQQPEYANNVIVVKYSNEKSGINKLSDFEKHCNLKAIECKKVFDIATYNTVSANLNRIYKIKYHGNESPIVVAKKMAQNSNVEFAEPYWIPELLGSYNDPLIANQYYLATIKADSTYSITEGDTNIVVGVVDTGVDIYHDDLKDAIKYNYADPINGKDDDHDGYIDNFRGWDLGNNDNNPSSTQNPHGTNVAGIIAATTNNQKGIMGVGNKTKILPIKVSEDSEGALIAAYEGIVYAANHGCKIINCSWGNTNKSEFCNEVIKYAQSKGCLIIAAAGNSRTNVKYYPASYNGVISVAATNINDIKWSGSSYNYRVDLCAPGDHIYTTLNNNNYQYTYGTSMAAPMVSAAAALVWAARRNLTATQIGELLRVTADRIDTLPDNSEYRGLLGSGRINILKACLDTTSPSVRIVNSTISSPQKTIISGDDISIKIDICNYLYTAHNLKIEMTIADSIGIAQSNTYTIDSLVTADTISVAGFKVSLANNLPSNYNVAFVFKFTADNYYAEQVIEMVINPNYTDIAWGEMKTTIPNNGKIGIYNYDAQLGNGFTFQNKYNMISDGALIIALDSRHIASAYQNDNQFTTITQPTISKHKRAQQISSTIAPTDIDGIEVHQKFIFDEQNLPTTMICNYQITTSRSELFQDASIGLYFDWDVVNSLTNRIEYDTERKMAYIYNLTNNNLYGGICLLSDNKATPHAFELSENGNSIDITNGFTQEQKWFAMHNSRPASTSENIDLALMLTSNNLTLSAYDTASATFAIIAAENLYELNRYADKAKELYGTGINTSNNTTLPSHNISVFPNPFTTEIIVENANDIIEIEIYNILGNKVYSQKNHNQSNISIPTNKLPHGTYNLVITTLNGQKQCRLMVK